MKNSKFRSCFIVDVQMDQNEFRLTDSYRNMYRVDTKDREVVQQFLQWFKSSFIPGVAQTVTVFAYEVRGEGPDIQIFIKKFYNLSEAQPNTQVDSE